MSCAMTETIIDRPIPAPRAQTTPPIPAPRVRPIPKPRSAISLEKPIETPQEAFNRINAAILELNAVIAAFGNKSSTVIEKAQKQRERDILKVELDEVKRTIALEEAREKQLAKAAARAQKDAEKEELARKRAEARAQREAERALERANKPRALKAKAILDVAPQIEFHQRELQSIKFGDQLPIINYCDARKVFWDALSQSGTNVLSEALRAANLALVAYINKHLIMITRGESMVLSSQMSQFSSTNEPQMRPLNIERIAFGYIGECPSNIREQFAAAGKELDAIESTSLLQAWTKSAQRRQALMAGLYPHPMIVPDQVYNTFYGFNQDIKLGDPNGVAAKLFIHHIRHRICKDDVTTFNYVMAYLAGLIQAPGERCQWALVLKGEKGSGKGIIYNALQRIIGSRYCRHPSSADQLLGRFNQCLENSLLVFCDELAWAGSHEQNSNLKKIITESHLDIEPKGQKAYQVANLARILIASNEEWVVPASGKERRFVICDMSDELSTSPKLAKELWDAVHSSGINDIAAMLHSYKYDSTLLNRGYNTEDSESQVIHTLSPVALYIQDKLQNGSTKLNGIDFFGQKHPNKCIYDDYLEFCKRASKPHPLNHTSFFIQLHKILPEMRKCKFGAGGKGGYGICMYSYEDALRLFRISQGLPNFMREYDSLSTAEIVEYLGSKDRPYVKPRATIDDIYDDAGPAEMALSEDDINEILAEFTDNNSETEGDAESNSTDEENDEESDDEEPCENIEVDNDDDDFDCLFEL